MVIAAVAVAGVAGLAAVARLRTRPTPEAQPPEPLPVATAAAPQDAAPQADAPGRTFPEPPAAATPAPESPSASSAPAPAEPSASEGRKPEPASCGIFSPEDIASAPRRPSVSTSWYQGASGFRRAGEEQSSSGAPLLLLFYTDWCPHCRRFIADVLPSREMGELGERIIKVKVNPETSGDDQELAKRFSVRSYPTLLMIAAPGGSPVRLQHSGSPRVFVESCERALPDQPRQHLDRGISLARRGAIEQAANELKAAAGDPKLATIALDHLGTLALGASCFSRATAIYGRILDIDSTYQGGRAYHLRGFARLRSGDAPRALEDAEHACRLGYKDGCTVSTRLRISAR